MGESAGWGAGEKTDERSIVVRGGGSQWASCFFLPSPLEDFSFSAPVPTGACVCELVTSRRDTAWRRSCELESKRVPEGVRAFFPACTVARAVSLALAPTPFARSRSHSHRRRSLALVQIDGCVLEDLISYDECVGDFVSHSHRRMRIRRFDLSRRIRSHSHLRRVFFWRWYLIAFDFITVPPYTFTVAFFIVSLTKRYQIRMYRFTLISFYIVVAYLCIPDKYHILKDAIRIYCFSFGCVLFHDSTSIFLLCIIVFAQFCLLARYHKRCDKTLLSPFRMRSLSHDVISIFIRVSIFMQFCVLDRNHIR